MLLSTFLSCLSVCVCVRISFGWETYMQVRKQQLELDMEQQTGSK